MAFKVFELCWTVVALQEIVGFFVSALIAFCVLSVYQNGNYLKTVTI